MELFLESKTQQKSRKSRDRRHDSRRSQWMLVIVSLVLGSLTVAAILWGLQERRHRENISKTAVQERQNKETIIQQQDEFLALVFNHLGTIQQHLNKGHSGTQAALEQLPGLPLALEAEINALEQQIQTLEARLQPELIARELDELHWNHDTDFPYIDRSGMRWQIPDIETTRELLQTLQAVWTNAATLTQLATQQRLIEFRRERLLALKESLWDETDAEILEDISNDLYQVYEDLDTFPNTFDMVSYSNFLQNYHYRYTNTGIPWFWENGDVPQELTDSIRHHEQQARSLEERLEANITAIYEAGQRSEKDEVQQFLRAKVDGLGALRQHIQQLRQTLAASEQKKQGKLDSLKKSLYTTSSEYQQAITTLQATQHSVKALARANEAYRQGRFNDAIQAALQTLRYCPEHCSAYCIAIQSLVQLHTQQSLSPAFLAEIFQDTIALSSGWETAGGFKKLNRENQKYLMRIYYEFSICFTKDQKIDDAVAAVNHALKIARLVNNNDQNIDRLRAWHQRLENALPRNHS